MAKLDRKYEDALQGDRGEKGVFDKKDAKALTKYYRKREGLSKRKAKRKAGRAPLSTKLKVGDSFRSRVIGKSSKKQYGDKDKIDKSDKLTRGFNEGKNIRDAGKSSNFKRYTNTIEEAAKEKFKINSRDELMQPKELKVSYSDAEYDTKYKSRLSPDGMLSRDKNGNPLSIAQAPTSPSRFSSASNPRMGSLASRLKMPTANTSRADLIAKGKKRLGR